MVEWTESEVLMISETKFDLRCQISETYSNGAQGTGQNGLSQVGDQEWDLCRFGGY